MTELMGRLQEIMRRVFDQDDLKISRELSAGDVDGWDSLSHVHLIVAIEKQFKISIPSTEAMTLKTVGDLIDLVQKLSKASLERF